MQSGHPSNGSLLRFQIAILTAALWIPATSYSDTAPDAETDPNFRTDESQPEMSRKPPRSPKPKPTQRPTSTPTYRPTFKPTDRPTHRPKPPRHGGGRDSYCYRHPNDPACYRSFCERYPASSQCDYCRRFPSDYRCNMSPGQQDLLLIQSTSGPQGEYLVDAQGNSLYLFMADRPNYSNCFGECSEIWPPVTVDGGQVLTVMGNVQNRLLGTFLRSDGQTQVTYNGWPLYYYSGDQLPGDTKGQGLNDSGALWYLMSPSGVKLQS